MDYLEPMTAAVRAAANIYRSAKNDLHIEVKGEDKNNLVTAYDKQIQDFLYKELSAAFPGCADDAEPSARTVAFLIDKVRAERVPAVFYIEFSNEKMADIICEETGCQKLLFHSCHNVTAAQLADGVSYLELMEQNLVNLKEALG